MGSQVRRYRFIATALAAIAGGLVAGSQPAAALSFVIPDGAVIEDIDFSGNAVANFDTDRQGQLFVEIDATVIRLAGGGEIPLGGDGEGTLTMRMELNPLASESDGSNWLVASFDGTTPHIEMLDGLDGVVFQADFTNITMLGPIGGELQLFDMVVAVVGSFGGDFQAAPLANEFTGALSSLRGNISMNIAGTDTSIAEIWNGTGLDPFVVLSSTLDYSHAPEPGTGLLIGLGLAALAAARRLRH
jgi:hypothetical protein